MQIVGSEYRLTICNENRRSAGHTIAEGKEIRWQLQVVDVNYIPLVLHTDALNVAHMTARNSPVNPERSICELMAQKK